MADQLTACPIDEELSAHLDDELAPEQRAALEQHLSGCQPCRSLLEELRQTRDAVAGLRKAPAPRDFVFEVQRRIALSSRGRFFRRRVRPGGDTLAMLLAMLLVTMLLALAALFVFVFDEAAPTFPPGAPGPAPAEGSWGEPGPGGFRLWLGQAGAGDGVRRTLDEVLQSAGLPPPREEDGRWLLSLPRERVRPLLETITARLPARVERVAEAALPGSGAGDRDAETVTVEVVLGSR